MSPMCLARLTDCNDGTCFSAAMTSASIGPLSRVHRMAARKDFDLSGVRWSVMRSGRAWSPLNVSSRVKFDQPHDSHEFATALETRQRTVDQQRRSPLLGSEE